MMIDAELMVDEVMRRWPATVEVFLRRRMLCVGCAIARFCTIEDACAYHGQVMTELLAELDARSQTLRRVRTHA